MGGQRGASAPVGLEPRDGVCRGRRRTGTRRVYRHGAGGAEERVAALSALEKREQFALPEAIALRVFAA